MHTPAITGTGVFTPDQIITNDELVAAFNAYAERFNAENAEQLQIMVDRNLEYEMNPLNDVDANFVLGSLYLQLGQPMVALKYF